MEIGVLSSFVSIVISLGIVLITYVKTWVSLDSSIKNLSKVVDRLQKVLDDMVGQQGEILQDVRVVQTKVEEMSKRIDKVGHYNAERPITIPHQHQSPNNEVIAI